MATIIADPRFATAESPCIRTCGAQTNYFDSTAVAARYTRVRPHYHGELAERLRSFAGVERFGKVLDVGCGTGHSSIALAEIADQVTAIDPSPSMLAAAQPKMNVHYQAGVAEHLDFTAAEFDLISAASALHWFNQEQFYRECRRVLASGGLLAIYNDHFTTHMLTSVSQQGESALAADPARPHLADIGFVGEPAACKRWMRTRFAKRYPAPRRGMRDFDEPRAMASGFTVVHRGSFSHLVAFTKQQFIAYLLTRSNTLAALAQGRESEPAIVDWLNGELAGILQPPAIGNFIFKCNYWLLQRA
jgi:SAM-dependent methyltransferase